MIMNIWIVNPFDDLPGEAGRPMRYWRLCRACVARGDAVTWWSSDFSHRLKSRRIFPSQATAMRHSEGFDIRLVHVPAYSRNVSFARWRNHRVFGQRWEADARRAVESGAIARPDGIVVSLPPIETAHHAFRLRQEWGCPVVLDIQDAWPETFLRLFPGPDHLRHILGRLCFASLFRQAREASLGADGISSTAQTYLMTAVARGAMVPTHLSCHGTDLDLEVGARLFPEEFDARRPLRVFYLGAMGRTYDLKTAIEAIARLRQDQQPISLHIAGQGPHEHRLRRLASALGVEAADSEGPGVFFNGFLQGDALAEEMSRVDVGLIPMDPASGVGVPNKLADYCCAGLPVLCCLIGETAVLLNTFHAGWTYRFRDVESLTHRLSALIGDPMQLRLFSHGSFRLAREHLDGNRNARMLAQFVGDLLRKKPES